MPKDDYENYEILGFIEIELPPVGEIIKQNKYVISFSEFIEHNSNFSINRKYFINGSMPSLSNIISLSLFDNNSLILDCKTIVGYSSDEIYGQFIKSNFASIYKKSDDIDISLKSDYYKFGNNIIKWTELTCTEMCLYYKEIEYAKRTRK